MKHRCSWCGNEHVLDPACDAAWKENGEAADKRITELKALNAKQSERIAELEAEREKRINKWAGLVEMWEKRTKTAKSNCRKLYKALKTYGYHTTSCEYDGEDDSSCSCGWAALGKGGGE